MRATDLPEKWQLLLTALNRNDEDEAQRICIKYQFNKDKPIKIKKRPTRLYNYYYTSPCGKQGIETTTESMARLMGITGGTVGFQFKNKDTAVWTKGPRAGWKLRRESR